MYDRPSLDVAEALQVASHIENIVRGLSQMADEAGLRPLSHGLDEIASQAAATCTLLELKVTKPGSAGTDLLGLGLVTGLSAGGFAQRPSETAIRRAPSAAR